MKTLVGTDFSLIVLPKVIVNNRQACLTSMNVDEFQNYLIFYLIYHPDG